MSYLRKVACLSALALLAWHTAAGPAQERSEEQYSRLREAMVSRQVRSRGVRDPAVIKAMLEVPRHLFVPAALMPEAYEDYPLPVGEGQTISQPYIVALMTQSLGLKPDDRVLEVGTGSGYQAAVLGRIVKEVYSIEINADLAAQASQRLRGLGFGNVHVKTGDGFFGWPEKAPFDGVIVTCAAPEVPRPLFEQLAEGRRLVIPLGPPRSVQELTVITKKRGRPHVEKVLDVRFVPMTGEAEKVRKR
jgi:protein-L-isoaspartate(D-aspartate) O-methyltransferase